MTDVRQKIRMNKPKSELTCETCNTSFSTVREEQEHQFSLMHHIRLDQAAKKKGNHRCCLCSLDVFGLNNYVSHLEGKKHKSNLAEFQKGLKEIEKVTDSKHGKSESVENSKQIKQYARNSNQSKEVSSPVTSLNHEKSTFSSTTTHRPFSNRKTFLPVGNHNNKYSLSQNDTELSTHITAQSNNNCDNYKFSEKMQNSQAYSCNSYLADDADCYDGWNFSSPYYPGYSQNSFGVEDSVQQNYSYWWNEQPVWRHRQWNEYSQRDRNNFQQPNDMSNYRYMQNNYRNYRNCASQTFSGTFNTKGNYNAETDKYRWHKKRYWEPTFQQKYDESAVNSESNQVEYSEKTKNKDKLGKNDASYDRHRRSTKARTGNKRCAGNINKPKGTITFIQRKQSTLRQNIKPLINYEKSPFKSGRNQVASAEKNKSEDTSAKNNVKYDKHNKSTKARTSNNKFAGNINKPKGTITLMQKKQSRLKQNVKPLVNKLQQSIQPGLNSGEESIEKQTKLSITTNVHNNKHPENTKKDETVVQNTNATSSKNEYNEMADIIHSAKFYKLSKILEESKVEIGSFDKELINKLVNFPRSRKEQLQLQKWIQEHSKSKKKLTFPRFNLPVQFAPSQHSKSPSEDSSAFLHCVVSEVVNNLEEGVIDSILQAIRSAEGDTLHTTTGDSKMEHFTLDSSKCCFIKSECSGQLSHAEKVQLLQNWITEAGKPQNRTTYLPQETNSIDQAEDICIGKDAKSESSHKGNTNREQITNFDSFQNSNFTYGTCDGAHKDFPHCAQNDSNGISTMQEVQADAIPRQLPTDFKNVRQDVPIKKDNFSWGGVSVKCENRTGEQDEIKVAPVCNPQNESSSSLPYRSRVPEDSNTQHMPHWSPGLISDVSPEVPVPRSRDDLVTVPDTVIKTEPGDTYENESIKKMFSNNQNFSTDYDEVNSGRTGHAGRDEIQQRGENTASLDAMINTLAAGSANNGGLSTRLEYVKDMLNKNKLLLQQITQILNFHVEQSNAVELPNQNLIQELLETSQQEEMLRLLGSRIDRIISYFFRFAEEWKAKRTKAFYEEMRLRTRRIQLLKHLQDQEFSRNQDVNSYKSGEDVASHPQANYQSAVPLSSLNISDAPSGNETVPSSTQNHNMPNTSESGNQMLENNVLSPENTCGNSSSKRIGSEKKRREPCKCSPLSVDPTNIQITENNISNNLNPPKRRRTVKTTTSKKKKKVEQHPASLKEINNTGTLAEVNERFWAEMDAWIRDMDFNSQSSIKHEYEKQEEESPETDWLQCNPILSSENTTRQCIDSSLPSQESSITKEIPFAIQNFEAHKSSVTDIKVHDGHLYTCSSDGTAKRFDLKDPSNVTVFKGHQKIVTSVQVADSVNRKVLLFTSSMDGHLRCFDNMSGDCLNAENIGLAIICMSLDWGKLYLGLPTGSVTIYSLAAKRIIDSFQCSKCPIGCISTSSEGAQKILCVSSYDSAVTIWDATTGLLLRCLEGEAKPPCKVRISGDLVYTSTNNKTLLIHSITSAKLQKVLNWPASATGLHVSGDFIISCSFDGMIRFYTKKGWILHVLYYGAGKSSVLSMFVYNDYIFTGNRNGLIEVFKFNPLSILPCQFGKCYFRFGRLEDLTHHMKTCHLSKMDDNLQSCPWRGCNKQFNLKATYQEKEDHIFQHARSTHLADPYK